LYEDKNIFINQYEEKKPLIFQNVLLSNKNWQIS